MIRVLVVPDGLSWAEMGPGQKWEDDG